MIGPKPLCPFGKSRPDPVKHALTRRKLGLVALAIVEADRFHPREMLKRPSQTGSRILSAGKQHQGRIFIHGHMFSV